MKTYGRLDVQNYVFFTSEIRNINGIKRFLLVSSLAQSSTPNIEAAYSSETSVDFQQITLLYTQENTILQL
jgi:hypothetical protein